jgi:hypothetical protein
MESSVRASPDAPSRRNRGDHNTTMSLANESVTPGWYSVSVTAPQVIAVEPLWKTMPE